VRNVAPGPRAHALKEQMDHLESDIKSMETSPDFVRIKNQKEEISKRREIDLNQSEKVASGLDGLLERIKIAHEISGFWISTFITLLFMVIELTPIFFKLMLIKSPYDYMEENIKELIKAENGIEVKANYYQDKVGIERDLVINHQVIRMLKEKIQLLETQSDLSQKAIETWKAKQNEAIAANPDRFIKEEQTAFPNG
jgi:uncharacterized protein DUF4407